MRTGRSRPDWGDPSRETDDERSSGYETPNRFGYDAMGLGSHPRRMGSQSPSIVSLDDFEEIPHAVVFEGEEPRMVWLKIDDGEEVPEHSHPDRTIVLFLVSGRLQLRIDGTGHELEAGDLARFGGDRRISPTAIEDSVALLVLAPRSE